MKTLTKRETANIIRHVVHEAFPQVGFKVRATTRNFYGHCVTVEWQDGPTEQQVKETLCIFDPYENGQKKNQSFVDAEGNTVKFETPVHVERAYSDEFWARHRRDCESASECQTVESKTLAQYKLAA